MSICHARGVRPAATVWSSATLSLILSSTREPLALRLREFRSLPCGIPEGEAPFQNGNFATYKTIVARCFVASLGLVGTKKKVTEDLQKTGGIFLRIPYVGLIDPLGSSDRPMLKEIRILTSDLSWRPESPTEPWLPLNGPGRSA